MTFSKKKNSNSQRQVVTSVRPTPGMAMSQSWMKTGGSPSSAQFQQPLPIQQSPIASGTGVWSQQSTGYMLSAPLGKRLFADGSTETNQQHGNWRMGQFGRGTSDTAEYDQLRRVI